MSDFSNQTSLRYSQKRLGNQRNKSMSQLPRIDAKQAHINYLNNLVSPEDIFKKYNTYDMNENLPQQKQQYNSFRQSVPNLHSQQNQENMQNQYKEMANLREKQNQMEKQIKYQHSLISSMNLLPKIASRDNKQLQNNAYKPLYRDKYEQSLELLNNLENTLNLNNEKKEINFEDVMEDFRIKRPSIDLKKASSFAQYMPNNQQQLPIQSAQPAYNAGWSEKDMELDKCRKILNEKETKLQKSRQKRLHLQEQNLELQHQIQESLLYLEMQMKREQVIAPFQQSTQNLLLSQQSMYQDQIAKMQQQLLIEQQKQNLQKLNQEQAIDDEERQNNLYQKIAEQNKMFSQLYSQISKPQQQAYPQGLKQSNVTSMYQQPPAYSHLASMIQNQLRQNPLLPPPNYH